MSTVRRAVKNKVANYSDIQVKVREATSNDPWGPSGALMSDIADATYNVLAFDEVISLLWKRLNDNGKNWRHVYKSLVVLDYILKTGSERVTEHCRDNIFTIQTLKDFVFIDKDGKDQGVNVREKSKHLVLLIRDSERLSYERGKAIKAKERFHSTTPVGSTLAKRRNSYNGTSQPSSAQESRIASPATTTALSPNTNTSNSQSWQVSRRANSATPTTGDRIAASPQNNLSADMARAKPSNEQEEALQIELAMALSREEEARRTTEEEELRNVLQATAIQVDPFATTVDGATAVRRRPEAADPWGAAASSSTHTSPQASAVPQPSSGNSWERFEDKNRGQIVNDADPWGTNSAKSSPAITARSSSGVPLAVTPELFPSSNGFGSPSVKRHPDMPPQFDPRPLAAGNQPQAQKEPASLEKKFLGDSGTLVNLDTIGGNGPVDTSAASSNPFGNPSPTATGTGMRAAVGNPFNKAKPQTPSLNQMRTREFVQPGDAAGSLLPAPLIPESGPDSVTRRPSNSVISPGPTILPPVVNPAQSIGMVPMGAAPVGMAGMPMNPMGPGAPAMGMQPGGMYPTGPNPFLASGGAPRNPNGYY